MSKNRYPLLLGIRSSSPMPLNLLCSFSERVWMCWSGQKFDHYFGCLWFWQTSRNGGQTGNIPVGRKDHAALRLAYFCICVAFVLFSSCAPNQYRKRILDSLCQISVYFWTLFNVEFLAAKDADKFKVRLWNNWSENSFLNSYIARASHGPTLVPEHIDTLSPFKQQRKHFRI